MKIIILNWSKGDNDPFTYGNRMMAQYLRANGKPAQVVDLDDPNLLNILTAEKLRGLEFVFALQGLGSLLSVTLQDGQQANLWEHLGIPLICVHADHPSIMPFNHTLDTPLCKHLYYDESACLFSNQYFRTVTSASTICYSPLDDARATALKPQGKYFVLMKNLKHPDDLERGWKPMLTPEIYTFFMQAVERVKSSILSRVRFVDFHGMLDQLIAADATMQAMHNPDNYQALFVLHKQLEFYVRNFKSVELLKRLRDYPVRVYGKGWDIEKAAASSKHEFHDGLNASESGPLFYSEYGVLDVSSYRGLHDRSLRAIANATPFLSDADIRGKFPPFNDYAALFYDFAESLPEARCEDILRNPEQHRERAVAFSLEYKKLNKADEFIKSLDTHAYAMRRA